MGAQPDLYYPGLFDAGPAPTGPPSNCSAAALDVPEGSAFPFWFGTATAAYQVEVRHCCCLYLELFGCLEGSAIPFLVRHRHSNLASRGVYAAACLI